jgi:hypothetical protein
METWQSGHLESRVFSYENRPFRGNVANRCERKRTECASKLAMNWQWPPACACESGVWLGGLGFIAYGQRIVDYS